LIYGIVAAPLLAGRDGRQAAHARTADVEEPTSSVICGAYWIMAGLSVFDDKRLFVQVVHRSITQGHAAIGVV